jgi:hypothetical protein
MSSSPPEKSSLTSPPSSPPSSSPPPCHSFFPSAAKEVEFGTAITTTADESIVSNAGEAIDWEAEVKEDTPTGEEKRQKEGRHRHCGEVRGEGSEERMVLSNGKCWGIEPAIHNAGKEAESGSRGTGCEAGDIVKQGTESWIFREM